MSEPTKEQIAEAREMVPIFDGYLSTVNGCPHISVHGLARLIAHVRKQARDDALEEAAKICDKNARGYGAAYASVCATEIRAMKDQPSGEA